MTARADEGGGRARSALIAALAAGASYAEAAERCGVSISTISRRMREPDFRAEVAAARAVLVEGALGRLAAAAGEAVDALRELLATTNEPVRVSAARTILENLSRLRLELDLDARLAALEARLAAREVTP